MAKKSKTSSDYPQLYVRIDESSKKVIDDLVETILKVLNDNREIGDPVPKRNEVIIKSLHKGLTQYLKEIK